MSYEGTFTKVGYTSTIYDVLLTLCCWSTALVSSITYSRVAGVDSLSFRRFGESVFVNVCDKKKKVFFNGCVKQAVFGCSYVGAGNKMMFGSILSPDGFLGISSFS